MNLITRHIMRPLGLAFLILLAAYPLVSESRAEEALKELSRNLIDLRGEVQRLNTELEESIANHRNRMQSLERQRGDLEIQIKRDDAQLKKLQNTLSKTLEQTSGNGSSREDLVAIVMAGTERSRERIRDGLPFKLEERLAELDDIKMQLDKKLIPPHQAINRLWAFTEDELRLVSENGLYRQPVVLDGEKHLADVARLGMALLYFETSDGRYGAARKDGAAWQFDEYTDRTQVDQLALLFDSLRKQIRTGYFTLPNALNDEVTP